MGIGSLLTNLILQLCLTAELAECARYYYSRYYSNYYYYYYYYNSYYYYDSYYGYSSSGSTATIVGAVIGSIVGIVFIIVVIIVCYRIRLAKAKSTVVLKRTPPKPTVTYTTTMLANRPQIAPQQHPTPPQQQPIPPQSNPFQYRPNLPPPTYASQDPAYPPPAYNYGYQ
ncbi:uncharacterized protein LOC127729347 isoform X2 [Mytilus californianus]|uniref:uncharacterized protein LOC127729347 isoform X2 n=1 Tax=Mytilus californianus TaxID=6549 RepID=UPI002247EEDD|nr:uncharacterized protein LOC127729347 isoform X2 [Mytilus californianus]